MARYCPITQCKVTYMFCQECDDRICKKTDFSNKNNDQKDDFSKSDSKSSSIIKKPRS